MFLILFFPCDWYVGPTTHMHHGGMPCIVYESG